MIKSHQNNRKIFAAILIVLEILIIILYGFFVRPQVQNDPTTNVNYYPMYQDVNVMMLIGFGFLMTFIRTHAWSALSYTFFINSIIVQIYLLLSPFWQKVFQGQWSSEKIFIVQRNFTGASYSVASVLIAFGAVLGRVGELQLLIMGLVQIIGYTLNQQICYNVIKIYDDGGSTVIHAFGAYFGLTASLVLSRSIFPRTKPQASYVSNIFAMIGTLFLWMFWPSFNAGFTPITGYQKTTVISNTILALTGSCISTFTMTALIRNKFSMNDILNATLAGGVMIGSSSGLFVNFAAALSIGAFAGVVSTLGYYYLTDKLQQLIGLQDTCGVHNLHGIPGVLGGIFSAIAIASYVSFPLSDSNQISLLNFYANPIQNRSFYKQGGFQIAGTFISMGMGIAFGLIAGLLMRQTYHFDPNQFYKDDSEFQLTQLNDQLVKHVKQVKNNPQRVADQSQEVRNAPQTSKPFIQSDQVIV